MVPLRCLLFSSNAETIQPIWQVLTDLGIEGEHCHSAVDAVEKVTTQSFQLVITDWDDQPEAAFLLKTTRDLKAAQRPLTLAIVSDDARLPEALQAGANSILLKPIRAEQVRDTMGTACELLRSKIPAAMPPSASSKPATMAAAASAGSFSLPGSVLKALQKIRPPAPAASFDTESTSVESSSPDPNIGGEAPSAPSSKPPEVLTGWAMLQARLTRSVSPGPRSAAPGAPRTAGKSELLAYGDPSYGTRAEASPAPEKVPAKKDSGRETEPEAALFAYLSGKPGQQPESASKSPRLGKVLMVSALVAASLGLAAVPRTRQSLQTVYQKGVRAGSRLLNPPPAALPEAVALHDSFGQSGDEYKLPVAVNIPDATTDPSQIRVLPMIDPTAKPQKNLDANTGQEQTPSENIAPGPAQSVPSQTNAEPSGENDPKVATPTSVGNVPANGTEAPASATPTRTQPAPVAPALQPQPMVQQAAAHFVASRPNSASVSAAIPSSLRSQIASTIPQNSGSKPVEAAMSSIEPINLPEPVAREFLIQPVDPVYPASARASGLRGSVSLQVLIGRDGSVQDAKFLQGSLVFARAAIDAVKQWRFKPYSFNGRPVSVQSVMTLNFKPPV
ncbi:MAG: outer rane transport energization protein TonB [Candidatus Sulfotelmatobacter sp.]|nr:outer rane transport energization protein TonB [Candidatus Sulfotelmatobacter sp.]